jgi:hypothetical protein
MSAYDDLRAELDSTKHVNNASERERIVGTVAAKALVDIAETLSSLLAVVSMPAVIEGYADHEPDAEPQADTTAAEQAPRPLEVGDTVTAETSHLIGTIVELGESEGEPIAVVEWPDGSTTKVWVSVLVRFYSGEGADEFDAPAAPTDAELEEMPADAFAALKKGKTRGKA